MSRCKQTAATPYSNKASQVGTGGGLQRGLMCGALLAGGGLIERLPPLVNSASKFPRFVGPYHKEIQILRGLKARNRNFKKVVQRRTYLDILDKSKRYRGRQQCWNALGAHVSINQAASYMAGRHRPSTSQRISAAWDRARARQPAGIPRNQGHRRARANPNNSNL